VTGRSQVFLDLDQTLIFSSRALEALGVCADGLVVAERLDGRAVSFAHPGLRMRLEWLGRLAEIIPVTARTRAQYERVDVFGAAPARAVVCNGGEILHDGVLDPSWQLGAPSDQEGVAGMGRMLDLIARSGVVGDDGRLRSADGHYLYLALDREDDARDREERMRGLAVSEGWGVSRQGRCVYVVPPSVSKGAAVAALRVDGRRAFAAGDSRLDLSMLAVVDHPFAPRGSECALLGDIDGLEVSATAGPQGAVEILDAMLDAVVSAGAVR
jgi:hypothetical protein